MSEETRKVLDLLAAGKISVDEAERLLKTLERSGTSSTAAGGSVPPGLSGISTAGAIRRPRPRYLRVQVSSDEDGEKVNIRVPLSLLSAGIKLTALLPEEARSSVQQAMQKKGIPFDLTAMKSEDLDSFIDALGELTIEAGDAGDHVRIFCE